MKITLKKFKIIHKFSLPLILLIALISLIIITFEIVFEDKFYPGIFIGDSNLTLLTKPQAYQVLNLKIGSRLNSNLEFSKDTDHFSINLATASASVNTSKALEEAFSKGRSGTLFKKIADQVKFIILKQTISPEIDLSIDQQIEPIAKAIHQAPKDATLHIESSEGTLSAKIKVEEAKFGLELDRQDLDNQIKNYIIFGTYSKDLPLKEIEPKITTQKANLAKTFIEEAGKQPIKLTFGEQTFVIDSKTLSDLLDIGSQALISQEKLSTYLTNISKKINQSVVEGQFNFDPATGRVSLFKPSQEGRKLDIDKTATFITLALEGSRSKTISLPVAITQPKLNLEDANNLGIKELIGRGISHFAGSIPNRIYNVNLTASKMNGVLIPPGEVFSFNQTVGDVSADTGFKQAYVIKSGRTVLDDGGGVCQDSTTLFRAVLNAGLPVVSRTAHAYRVGYYEQGFPPGLDATVFHPTVDFKFKNDTPAHILIQVYTSGITLYVDLYGTSDGRVATISKSVVTNQAPPPPELRQDDPNLPKGEVKQVDFSAWGATVSFSRTVKRGGQTLINETFRSVYKPWQAIFLVGTKEG